MFEEQNVFASSKVANEKNKILAYLRGENIFPTTIELDLTQKCTRSCQSCPYMVSRRAGLTLKLSFVDRLFGILSQETPGIVLSGGEPTTADNFPEIIALTRKSGFKEVAVISNGGMTHLPVIQDALMEHVTSIRFSLYDWQETEEKYFIETLRKINKLRKRIDQEGSSLEIGASILTRKKWNHRLKSVGLQAIDAGIHWLYFHPFCVDWDTSFPRQDDQTGVLDTIRGLIKAAPSGSNIQVPYERYLSEPLYFEKLHGSHFLIQVGADGINYAGPECKYETDSVLLDLNEYMKEDFLWHSDRIKKIDKINNNNYNYIGTKHRPPMFSNFIQTLIDRKTDLWHETISTPEKFFYPNIV